MQVENSMFMEQITNLNTVVLNKSNSYGRTEQFNKSRIFQKMEKLLHGPGGLPGTRDSTHRPFKVDGKQPSHLLLWVPTLQGTDPEATHPLLGADGGPGAAGGQLGPDNLTQTNMRQCPPFRGPGMCSPLSACGWRQRGRRGFRRDRPSHIASTF